MTTGSTLAAFGLTLLLTAAAVTELMLATFAVALRVGRFNVVEVSWGLGFAVAAVVSFGVSAGHGTRPRRAAARRARCGRCS